MAGGSDSYGYLSETELWLSHRLHIEQPWVQQMPWPDADWTFTPLAYRAGATPHSIVPTYPPGFPLLLAGSTLTLGPMGAPLVVPALGALMVWITFLLGRDATGDPATGALAASIVATTPVFLYQVMPAMSDVPAAAFWSLSFWCGFVRRKHLPLVSGLAAAVAVLIRPNLILLTCVPAVAWLVKQRKNRTPRRDLWRDVARLGLGVSPALLLIAALNAYLYGAPWISGYGGFSSLYSFANLGTNLRHYARWFYEAQTLTLPLGLVLLAVPPKFYGSVRDVAPTRWGFIAAIALTMVSYAFYTPFDGWVFLRFLLPALPICAVVVAAAPCASAAAFRLRDARWQPLSSASHSS